MKGHEAEEQEQSKFGKLRSKKKCTITIQVLPIEQGQIADAGGIDCHFWIFYKAQFYDQDLAAVSVCMGTPGTELDGGLSEQVMDGEDWRSAKD